MWTVKNFPEMHRCDATRFSTKSYILMLNKIKIFAIIIKMSFPGKRDLSLSFK